MTKASPICVFPNYHRRGPLPRTVAETRKTVREPHHDKTGSIPIMVSAGGRSDSHLCNAPAKR
ncbi:MAG: hypothetical protein KDA89_02680, partial [Planctomycetaceae bacterium]|nr:hypothetical protein [Planctomycetaceae bacterium]